MYERKCPLCREYFEPRNEYEKLCYGCYHLNRTQNHKEEKSKLQLQIAYLQDQNYRLVQENHRWSNCINELVNREILKDFIFLCNHDRNEIGERLDRVIKWLNRLYSLLLEKNFWSKKFKYLVFFEMFNTSNPR